VPNALTENRSFNGALPRNFIRDLVKHLFEEIVPSFLDIPVWSVNRSRDLIRS
jgi:hypothetical protein